ncbi:lysis system i-spanin subunit Rz [Aquabacterium sp.]|uniref:lysis system i-spanin subunit Rz n=1 Tax=Aquabacterium sp. TaxID=1872578 RepID=UPI0025BB548D|nr:lysis system i-spanin subunit Rz [Aquabacterium sp.]
MNPLAKYGAAVAITLASLYGAYRHGCTVTQAAADLATTKANAAHAAETISLQAQVRAAEHKATQDMAAIDAQHQKDIADERSKASATLASYRAGTLRLRDEFAPTIGPAQPVLPGVATSTGKRDAAGTGGLQPAHVEFLVQIASDADQVAKQLAACQAVVRADRGQ